MLVQSVIRKINLFSRVEVGGLELEGHQPSISEQVWSPMKSVKPDTM